MFQFGASTPPQAPPRAERTIEGESRIETQSRSAESLARFGVPPNLPTEPSVHSGLTFGLDGGNVGSDRAEPTSRYKVPSCHTTVRRARGARTGRIAHGVRAIEDPALIAEVARRGVALDVCPTSNIWLGVPSLAEHPLPRLYAAGVVMTINSDDPPLFGTTLNDEVALLADPFGLDISAIDNILLNGVRHSFLPASAKQRLAESYRAELDRLKVVHLQPRTQAT